MGNNIWGTGEGGRFFACSVAFILNYACYFSVIFSGESASPEKVRDALAEEMEKIIKVGLEEKDFQRIKKSTYGILIRELNNVESVANLMINAHMDGVKPYDAIEILSDLTSSDCTSFIRDELSADKLAMSVVEGAVQ